MQKLTDLTKEELIELIVREREASSEWQPIESAPKDGTYVQLWRKPSTNQSVSWSPIIVAKWSLSPFTDDAEIGLHLWLFAHDGDVFNDVGLNRAQSIIDKCAMYYSVGDGDFTHWQPLPVPPAEIE